MQCQQEAPPELSAPPHQAQLAPVQEEGAECLKCNTFAELQERLDCIDGSEEVICSDMLSDVFSPTALEDKSCPIYYLLKFDF